MPARPADRPERTRTVSSRRTGLETAEHLPARKPRYAQDALLEPVEIRRPCGRTQIDETIGFRRADGDAEEGTINFNRDGLSQARLIR